MGAVACDFCRCEPGRCAKPADAQAKADAANARSLRLDTNTHLPCDDCGAPIGFVRAGCCDPGTGDECDAVAAVNARLRIEGDGGQYGGPLAEPCTGGCGLSVADCIGDECGPCHLCGGPVGDRGGDVVCQQCSDAINPPVALSEPAHLPWPEATHGPDTSDGCAACEAPRGWYSPDCALCDEGLADAAIEASGL